MQCSQSLCWGGTTRSKKRRDEDCLMSSPLRSSVREPETAVSQQVLSRPSHRRAEGERSPLERTQNVQQQSTYTHEQHRPRRERGKTAIEVLIDPDRPTADA